MLEQLGFTALHLASEGGNTEMLQLLLDGGADTEAKNNFGNKPQDLANKRATREVFRKHAEAAAAQVRALLLNLIPSTPSYPYISYNVPLLTTIPPYPSPLPLPLPLPLFTSY
ncbi:hypothetical protein B484DRAFT_200760 [Ochromonadaceae sp. CCMP2298]|nr:hypothetical protein B484DRAFT_200760 [Ochromonadaceae sp. CCMP2298]